jgi:2-polyprenyl-3-methyl-5-hydroxy-6-metoxy-1,4-benzoquinol methylase
VNLLSSTAIEHISTCPEVNFVEEWYEYAQLSHFWMVWRFAALKQQLQMLGLPCNEPKRVLDIGGGAGILSQQFESSTAWTVDCADLNLAALSQRERTGRGRLLFYNVQEERSDLLGTYDVVVLYDVIEHLAEPSALLKSAVRHLKPNGYLLINVPALQMLYSAYDKTVGHYRRYNKKTLTQELSGLSLEIKDQRYWGMLMLPLLLLRQALLLVKRQNVVRTGFVPPAQWINSVLRTFASFESKFLPHPPGGTSLMMACQKAI